MSRTLSVLYRQLIIETRSEVVVIAAALGFMYWAYQTLFGDAWFGFLLPTLLIGAVVFDRLRRRTSN